MCRIYASAHDAYCLRLRWRCRFCSQGWAELERDAPEDGHKARAPFSASLETGHRSFANWFISPRNRAKLLRCAVREQSGSSEAKASNETVRSGTRNLNEEALRWRAVKVVIAIDHILTNVAIGYGFLTIKPRRHPLTSHKCAQNMGCCRREMSLSTRQEWRSAADKSNLKIAGLRETFTAESQ